MNRAELKKAAETYLSALPSSGKSEQTAKSYLSVLKRFTAFAEQLDGDIVPSVIIRYRELLFEQKLNPNTINYHFVVLHKFFDWCEKMELATSNPVMLEEAPERKEILSDYLTVEEIEKLLNLKKNVRGVHSAKQLRNQAIVTLILQSGLRNAELRKLTPEALDFENRTIFVECGKGGKSRTVPFPMISREIVGAYLQNSRPADLSANEPLFGAVVDEQGHATENGRWRGFSSDAALSSMIERYIYKILGKHGITAHDLRHGYASYASHKGATTRDLSLTMGHSSQATTERIYISVLDKTKAASNVTKIFD